MEANVKAYERFLQLMEWLWCTLGYAGLLCVSIVVIEGGVSHSDWKYLHQRLLPATANFLSLSEKNLVIAIADIPDHVAERKRERSNQCQSSQVYPLSCTSDHNK